MGMKFKGLVLGEDTNGVDIGIDAVTQGKVDDSVFAPIQNSWFGYVFVRTPRRLP